MLNKSISLIGLLGALMLSGCDKDPLSDKGKVFLPDDTVSEQSEGTDVEPQTSNETSLSNGNIFEYSPVEPEENQSTTVADSVSAEPAASSSEVMKIDWDSLIPNSHRPDSDLIDQYNNGEIEADDPKIIALKSLMQELLDLAPVNKQLEGKIIRLPGFVIPVEHDGDKISEFLLVPYHGACIHVPAPPSNQIVYVRVPGGTDAAENNYDTVYVTGRLTIEKTENDVAETGYVIDALEVVPFE